MSGKATAEDRIDEVLRDHVQDTYEEPRIVTDWIVCAASQGADDSTVGYSWILRDGMAPHQVTGLLKHFLDHFDQMHASGWSDE